LILVDTNLLIYSRIESLPQHATAQEWLDSRLNDPVRVVLPWASLLGFLRIVTNARVFERALTLKTAWAQVEAWLGLENVWIPQPTEKHAAVLGQLLDQTGSVANRVPDAHLAALAVEHGLTLCSADGGFARFQGLHWINPLASAN
jgi:uncharacterized protein